MTSKRNRQQRDRTAMPLTDEVGLPLLEERGGYARRRLFAASSDLSPLSGWQHFGRALVSTALSLALVVQPFLTQGTYAQVISDPNAPITFRPTVGTSSNGTPTVNIVTPSFGGVSHNKYQNYNIDTRGIILNNSALGGTSVIGGQVSGNPNLVGSAPARVIINEVTGSGSSLINGPTEVFGSKGDVIVANPNGVSCISCGFINAGRVTLTTGTPTPNYDTGAVSYNVTKGTVSISGAGLNGGPGVDANGQAGLVALGDIDLIGRQLQVNGPVLSKGDVRLRAGAINYDQNADVTTPIAGADAVSGPAISSSASGTITAGSLSVLSSDVDLAIDLSGNITTLDGNLTVKGAGDVTLATVGSNKDIAVTAAGTATFEGLAQAFGRITANARAITVTDPAVLAANDAIILQALDSISSTGTVESGTAVSLTAGGDITASGVIVANGQVAIEGASVHADNLSAAGTTVTVSGLSAVSLDDTGLAATGDIRVSAPSISLGQQTGFQAGGTIALQASQDFSTDSILNYPNLDLIVRDKLSIGTHGGIVADNLAYSVTDTIDNAGLIYGRLSTVLDAATITNETSGIIYGPDVTLNVGSSLTNLGKILSDHTMAVLAGGAGVSNNGLIQSNGTLSLTSASYTTHSAEGALAGATATLIVSGVLDNAGSILGTDSLDITAGSLDNEGTGSIRGATARLAVIGDLVNAGLAGAVSDLTIKASTVANSGSLIAAQGALDLDAGSTTSSGTIAAGDTVKLSGGSYDGGAGSELGGKAVSVDLSGLFHNAGLVAANTTLTLQAGSLSQDAGGTLYGGDSAKLTLSGDAGSTGDADNAGAIIATDLTLTAAELTNQASGTIKAGIADLTTAGDLTNKGSIAALGLLGITAGGALDNEGSLESDQDMGLAVTGAWTNNGTADAAGTLVASAASLANGPAGHIQANALQLGLTGDAVNHGTIVSDTDLVLQAASLANAGSADGAVAEISGQDLTVVVTDALANGPYAVLQGGKSATVAAGTSNLDLTHSNDIAAGQFNFGKSLTYELTNSGLTIDAGKTLEVDGKLAIQVSGDIDVLGTVAAAGDLYLQSTGGSINIGNADPNNPGGAEVFTLGNATLVSAKDIVNNNSIIQAEGDIVLSAAGRVENLRMGAMVWPDEFQAWLDGAYSADAHRAPTGWYERDPGPKDGQYLFYYAQIDEFPNLYSSIEAGGSIQIVAQELDNVGSTIAANGDLIVRAQTVNNTARTSEVYRQEWRVQGDDKGARGGPVKVTADEDSNAIVQTPALPVMFAGGTIDIVDANGTFNLAGTLQGQYIHIDGQTVTTGISDPNEFVLPNKVPDTSIDLASYYVGAGAVNAAGGGLGAPDPVTENGVTYLHGAPLAPAGQRDPSWILAQVGNTRGDLTFFADPLTEQHLIEQALVDQTGRALLDPKYKDPAQQQEALWQGTVDFLKAHPDIHLGDELTDAQKASITEPLLWYTNDNGVLTPELLLPKDQVDALTKQMGGMVLGRDIYISGDLVTNTGNLVASDQLLITAGGFINNQRAVYDGWDAHLQDGGSIKAADIGILTMGDLDVVGGSLAASGDITLQSLMGDVNILPQMEQVVTRTADDGEVTTVTRTIAAGADIQAGGALDIVANTGNIVIEASNLKGDGIVIDAAQAVKFLAGTDETLVQVTGKRDNGITVTHFDHGSYDTSLVYDTIDAGAGGLTVSAPGGVVIDYEKPAGAGAWPSGLPPSFAEAIAGTLSDGLQSGALAGAGQALTPEQAGLGWMSQVVNDPALAVSFDGLTTEHQTWNNDVTTMNPVAAAIIGVIAGIAVPFALGAIGLTAGIASAATSALGSMGVSAATASIIGGAIADGVVGFATSLTTGVLEGAITGNMDMGAILMGALAAGLTAGLISGVNAELFGTNGTGVIVDANGDAVGNGLFGSTVTGVLAPESMNGLGMTLADLSTGDIVNSLIKIGVDAPIQAGVSSLLNGSDFEDGLVSGLRSGLSNEIIEPIGFAYVGDIIGSQGAGSLEAVLLHAVVGGAGGFVVNGVKGAEGGALGAAFGELLVNVDGSLPTSGLITQASLTQLAGALGSIIVGDATLAGQSAAMNGFEYNYLSHKQIDEAIKELENCKSDSDPKACMDAVDDKYLNLSAKQQNDLYNCPDEACVQKAIAEIQDEYANIDEDMARLKALGDDYFADSLLKSLQYPNGGGALAFTAGMRGVSADEQLANLALDAVSVCHGDIACTNSYIDARSGGIGLSGILAIAGGKLGGLPEESAGTGCSFDGTTLVETNHGFMAIRDVRPGIDEVWSRDADGQAGFKVIQKLFEDWHPTRLYLTIRSLSNAAEQTITTTTNHPFFAVPKEGAPVSVALKDEAHAYNGPIEHGGWVPAQELTAGYRLLDAGNGWAEVVSTRTEATPLVAYNLTVKDFHTFFVKQAGNDNAPAVLVHNACAGSSRPAGANTLYDADGPVMVTEVEGLPAGVTVDDGLADVETAGGKYYVKASDGNYYEVSKSENGTWSNTPTPQSVSSAITYTSPKLASIGDTIDLSAFTVKTKIDGEYYLEDPATGYYIQVDTAGHGGSAYKLYQPGPGNVPPSRIYSVGSDGTIFKR